MTDIEAGRFYHVRVSTRSRPTWDEVALDLSAGELESRFLAPRREGRPIVINGTTVSAEDLAQLKVNRSTVPSSELKATRSAEIAKKRTFATPENWCVAAICDDVTNELIREAPGSAMTATAAAPAALYVNATVTQAIRDKASNSQFELTKLLGLIEELNDNHARRSTYSAHAVLRALLDHVPPILGCASFNQVANNYGWGRTDAQYMKRLAQFREQADDALHRMISAKADVLDFDDMPASVLVDRLLQECADKL